MHYSHTDKFSTNKHINVKPLFNPIIVICIGIKCKENKYLLVDIIMGHNIYILFYCALSHIIT